MSFRIRTDGFKMDHIFINVGVDYFLGQICWNFERQ